MGFEGGNSAARSTANMEKEKEAAPAKVKGLLKGLFKKDKKLTIILAIGFLGIALIFFSSFFDGTGKTAEKATPESEITATQYAGELEQSLETFLSGIEGAGKTQVMVTLQNSGETLFLKSEKSDFDRNGAVEAGNFSERKTVSEDYVLVDGKEGRSTVVTTTKEPEIRGVIVACEGGGSSMVQAMVMDAVTTALDIGSNRVCITKLDKNSKARK